MDNWGPDQKNVGVPTTIQSRPVKSILQEKIDDGQISTITELMSFVAANNLKVTRNGADYLGLEDGDGKRFRVRFTFSNGTRVARPTTSQKTKQKVRDLLPGFWIYGLFVEHGNERACYIGQAVDYLRRAKDHLRGREGRSAWDLLKWAEARGAIVKFALLDFVPGERSPSLAAEATRLEGLWFARAQVSNFFTPGSERWGTLPRPAMCKEFLWPTSEVAAACRPLSDVCLSQLLPADVAIESMLQSYERLLDQVSL